MSHWLVDGMNLMGSRPDGWWRDRAVARGRLVAELARFAERTGQPVEVVFDGRHAPDEVASAEDLGVVLRFAPGGPNAADDVIASMVDGLADRAATTVVTSDAGLARRVQVAGGTVMGVGAFRRLLDAR